MIRITSIIFSISYVISAFLYSSFNPTKKYFCDLFIPQVGYHTKLSPSTIFAIGALISISIAVIGFFFWFSKQINSSKSKSQIIKILGCISGLLIASIGFRDIHDQALLLAIIFGIVPIAMIMLEVVKNWKKYSPILGLISFSILTFYTSSFYLNLFEPLWPVLQKISILLCLIWMNKVVMQKQQDNS